MAEGSEFLQTLDDLLDQRMHPITTQLVSNTETLSQVLRQLNQLSQQPSCKKPLTIEVTEDTPVEVRRPYTTDNRRRVEYLKAEESRKKKEDEDRCKEEVKGKRSDEERKKEEARKKLAEEKAAKDAAKAKLAEEIAKKKEAERLAKLQKDEEAKKERARKEEEAKAKKEEEKKQKEAERLARDEELAKKREAERLKKEESKKRTIEKKPDTGKLKPHPTKPEPAKESSKPSTLSPPASTSRSSSSSQPVSMLPVGLSTHPSEPAVVHVSDIELPDADEKLTKFSDDENLLLDKPEEFVESPDPLSEAIASMEKAYSQEQLQKVQPFALTIGSKSALKLLATLQDSEFFLDQPLHSDVLFALRLYKQLRGESLPEDDTAAWAVCQETLKQWVGQKFVLSVEVTKSFSELVLSEVNIDQVERILQGRIERVEPGLYGDTCALLSVLMFPLKDAVTYCGLVPEKGDPGRRYQRLLHKRRLVTGGF